MKNIARPVRVYRVKRNAGAQADRAALRKPKYCRRRYGQRADRRRWVVVAVAIAKGAIIRNPDRAGSGVIVSAAPVDRRIALRQSLDDPEQQYFADGITEDLTTDLSRIPNMLVISRNTAFTYKGKPVKAKQIGQDLGVRYVLEGSVRRSGNQVRITAQLIDAETEAHLWAERVDHEVSELFALQNVITSRIANMLSTELIAAEVGRPTDNPDAVDYILRGRDALAKGARGENLEKAIGLFERALALDPALGRGAEPVGGSACKSRNNGDRQATDFRRARR